MGKMEMGERGIGQDEQDLQDGGNAMLFILFILLILLGGKAAIASR